MTQGLVNKKKNCNHCGWHGNCLSTKGSYLSVYIIEKLLMSSGLHPASAVSILRGNPQINNIIIFTCLVTDFLCPCNSVYSNFF